MAITVRYDDAGKLAALAQRAGEGDAFARRFAMGQSLVNSARQHQLAQNQQAIQREALQRPTYTQAPSGGSRASTVRNPAVQAIAQQTGRPQAPPQQLVPDPFSAQPAGYGAVQSTGGGRGAMIDPEGNLFTSTDTAPGEVEAVRQQMRGEVDDPRLQEAMSGAGRGGFVAPGQQPAMVTPEVASNLQVLGQYKGAMSDQDFAALEAAVRGGSLTSNQLINEIQQNVDRATPEQGTGRTETTRRVATLQSEIDRFNRKAVDLLARDFDPSDPVMLRINREIKEREEELAALSRGEVNQDGKGITSRDQLLNFLQDLSR